MELDKVKQNGEAVVWEKRLAEQKRRLKIVQYIRFGLAGVFAVVLIIALTSFYGWTGKDAFGRLESYKSVSKTMNVSIALICILFCLKMCLEAFNGLVLAFLCRKKIAGEKWNVKAYIKNHSTDMTPAAVRKKYGACVTAAYWEDSPKALRLDILNAAVRAVLGIVTAICMGVFLMRFMDVAFLKGLAGDKLSLSDCDIRPLIAAGVFTALDIIASFVFYGAINKGFGEWLENVKK